MQIIKEDITGAQRLELVGQEHLQVEVLLEQQQFTIGVEVQGVHQRVILVQVQIIPQDLETML